MQVQNACRQADWNVERGRKVGNRVQIAFFRGAWIGRGALEQTDLISGCPGAYEGAQGFLDLPKRGHPCSTAHS